MRQGPSLSFGTDRPDEVDEITLARAQRGDDAACRHLVARYQQQVFSLLGRLLGRGGRSGLVEDLAQETFLRTFQSLRDFDSARKTRLSSWILTIATRLAIDELRRHRLATEPLDDAGGQPAPDAADEPAARRSLAAAIAAAVAALAPEYRATFVLRELHELEYHEIAAALSVDTGTVKSRLHRARAALRAALSEFHDE